MCARLSLAHAAAMSTTSHAPVQQPPAPHASGSALSARPATTGAAPAPQPGAVASVQAQAAVERAHPGRAAGVALGAVGLLLGVLIGLAALAATAVDVVSWTLNGS